MTADIPPSVPISHFIYSFLTHHTAQHTSHAHYIKLTAFSHQHAHPQMRTGPTVSATNSSLVLLSPRDLRNCLLAATSSSPHTSHIHRTILVSSPPPFVNTSSLPAPVINEGLLIPSPSALALCSTLLHFSLHPP